MYAYVYKYTYIPKSLQFSILEACLSLLYPRPKRKINKISDFKIKKKKLLI